MASNSQQLEESANDGFARPPFAPKQMKRECKFRDEYLSNVKFKNWLVRVPSDLKKAKCKYCNLIFSIKNEGISNLNKHMESSKHKKYELSVVESQTVDLFYNHTSRSSNSEELVVAAAEVSYIYHGIMHHHSFLSQECGIRLSTKLFSDSSLSQKLRCGRTKITAIVENVLSPFSIQILLKELSNGKAYSLATDASNKGNIKCWPLAITYFNKNEGAKAGLIDFYDDAKENADAVTNNIVEKLSCNNMDINNMVAFSADNASVNYGKNNSIFQKLCIRNNNMMIKANCNCHVLHNMAKHGRKNLKYDVETLVIKVYNEFSSSGKKIQELKGIFEFLEHEYSSLLRHMPIRWLTLLPALERLILHWIPLKAYFIAQGKGEVGPAIWAFIKKHEDGFLDDDALSYPELYIHFIQNYMHEVYHAVKLLESSDTAVTNIYDIMLNLRTELERRKEDNFFGFIVMQALPKFNPSQQSKFKKNAIEVYDRSLSYLNKWFSFEDSPFKLFRALSLRKEENLYENFIKIFKKFGWNFNGDELYKETNLLKMQMPFINKNQTDDRKWVEFFKNTKIHCPNLLSLAEHVFSIPISNAFVERIFSIMNNLWSDERNRMRPELVKSELCIRLNFQMDCSEFASFIKNESNVLDAARKNEKYKFKHI